MKSVFLFLTVYTFVFFLGSLGPLILAQANSTWNFHNVIKYFERPETKLPRTYLQPYIKEPDSEGKPLTQKIYYVRFDLTRLLDQVMSDLNFSSHQKSEIVVYTADSLRVVGTGCLRYVWFDNRMTCTCRLV